MRGWVGAAGKAQVNTRRGGGGGGGDRQELVQACRQQHPLAVGYWHGLPDDVGLAGSWQHSLLERWNFEAFGILKSAGKK